MDKNEILARSKAENKKKKSDERDSWIETHSKSFGWWGMNLALVVIAVFNVFSNGEIINTNVTLILLGSGCLGQSFGKYLKTKAKEELFFIFVWSILVFVSNFGLLGIW